MRPLLLAVLVSGCGGLRSPAPVCDAGCGGGSAGGSAGGSVGGGVGGGSAGGTAGDSGGTGGGSTGGSGMPVTTLVYDWKAIGSSDEYSIATMPVGQNLIWSRYVTGVSGVIAKLRASDGMTLGSQVNPIGPTSMVGDGQFAGFIGRGSASTHDWRVQWFKPDGDPGALSDGMNIVNGGGIISGAMFDGGVLGPLVHVLGPRDALGTHVSVIVAADGGVRRTETACGNTSWYDATTAGTTVNRFFIGSVQGLGCDYGDGQPVVAAVGQHKQVLVRYKDPVNPGVPTVRVLTDAAPTLPGPSALGATNNSVWISYYSQSFHLRLQRYAVTTVAPNAVSQNEAQGQPFVTGQTVLGLTVADVVPHLDRDRVYLLVTLNDPKSTFADEQYPAFNRSTLVVFTFDLDAVLLSVHMLPSSNAPKSASSMILFNDKLVVCGQCELTPAGGTTDPLCNPVQSGLTPFVFSMPAP